MVRGRYLADAERSRRADLTGSEHPAAPVRQAHAPAYALVAPDAA